MKHTACRLLAISSVALLLTAASHARTRPRYGDTLRAETQTVIMSGDSTPDALAGIVFETLVTVDDAGHLQPALATVWNSSNGGSRWEFALRRGVNFQDGTPLTATAIVNALARGSNQTCRARPGADNVTFECDSPQPNLPAILSLPQFAISYTPEGDDPVGTGPFAPNKRVGPLLSLKANDDYWDGRAFVDSLDLLATRSARDQATDFSLDRTDVIELEPDQLRRAQQDRLRLDASRPAETVFLVFDSSKPALRDPRLRQAISLAIDRAAIHNVIYQHQGEIASGLLPNWLTGYEFLFDSGQDVVRARQLRLEVGQLPAVAIGYDPADPTDRLIAERVALNAHDIGVNMQAVPATSGTTDIRIRRLSLASLDPAAALFDAVDRLGIAPAGSASPESLYAGERAALLTYTAIPLVHLPRVAVLKDRVRNWSTSPNGAWHPEQIWLAPRNPRVEVRP